jgi:electron transfer flavoprotein alpha/beta subunit
VNEIHIEEDALVVKRLADGFMDTIRVTLPALVSVASGAYPVRHIPLGALERAFSHEDVVRWGSQDLALDAGEVGLRGSATRVVRLWPPPPRKKGELLTGSPQDLAARFLEKLEALSLLDEEDETE